MSASDQGTMLEVLQAQLTAVKDQLDTRFIDEHGRHLDKAGKNYFWGVVTERGAKVDFPESKVWAKFKKENGADDKGQLLRKATVVPVAVSQAAAMRGGIAARPVLSEDTNSAAPATSSAFEELEQVVERGESAYHSRAAPQPPLWNHGGGGHAVTVARAAQAPSYVSSGP